LIKPKLLTVTGDTDVYIGKQEFKQPGTYYWQVPLSVNRLHVCLIGAGAYNDYAITGGYNGGGGGGLAWANDIEVTPGETLLVQVGAPSAEQFDKLKDSIIGRPKDGVQEFDTQLIAAFGGLPGQGGGFDLMGQTGGGGNGGEGSIERIINVSGQLEIWGGSGGGAGGYSGNGGNGVLSSSGATTQSGDGGAGAGGATFWRDLSGNSPGFKQGSGGGGVGFSGAGASGQGVPVQPDGANPVRGQAGSGGDSELYGGGGAGLYNMSPAVAPDYAKPGHGAVRIIWGIKYSYPDNADVSK
jgi:hypothetical protein